jgi:hypothetical protein
MEINAKVPVKKLLAKIKANAKKHESEHMKAMKGWHRKIGKEAAAIAKRAKSGKLGSAPWKKLAHFPKPVSHIADYRRVISILEMTDETEIAISSWEFDQMFNDNWEWKPDWTASNVQYSR